MQLILCFLHILTLKVTKTDIAEFANSVDLDEVAHNETIMSHFV